MVVYVCVLHVYKKIFKDGKILPNHSNHVKTVSCSMGEYTTITAK